jgi:O-methyltransferase
MKEDFEHVQDVAGHSLSAIPTVFGAQHYFSHKFPYKPIFAERVPLLQAFSLALSNYRADLGLSPGRWAMLRLVFHRLPPFRAAECGVFSGSSILACASIAQDQGVDCRFIGLDTFEGLPDLSEVDKKMAPPKASYRTRRLFTETSEEQVLEVLKAHGLSNRVQLRRGLFADTLPRLKEARYHFVNIDCDLYEPHLECLQYFYPRMMPGGVVFFDDYHSVDFPMAREAIDLFMGDKPEQLQHLRFGVDGPNRTKAFFVKY